jgi:hypothetical protein
MMNEIPESTALSDALSDLKKQCNVMRPEDPEQPERFIQTSAAEWQEKVLVRCVFIINIFFP